MTRIINLNCGNLWTDKYLDKVIELNKLHKDDDIQVASLFGSIAHLTPTARAFDRIPMLARDDFDAYVDKAQHHGIKIRYTINASCIGSIQSFKDEWESTLKDSVKRIHDAGVTQWTVTSPLLCIQLHELFPGDFIEVSTINEISTPNEAFRWSKLGADGICASIMINREPESIMALVGTGMKISLLANEACLYKCPLRRECYNLSSHDSARGERFFDFYPFRYCNTMRINNPVEWIRARLIAPQWMRTYQEELGIYNFKIAYRTHPYEVAIPNLELYMNQKMDGNFLDLWPSIKKLGDTAEPADSTYLDVHKLSLPMLNLIMNNGFECNRRICDVTCHVCAKFYENSVEKVEESKLVQD